MRTTFGSPPALLMLLTAAAHTVSSAPRAPRFSWDTLPVFYHSANASGLFNATSIATLAKFPLVTIEKFQGPLTDPAFQSGQRLEEENILAVAHAIKAVNPDVAVISYMHRRNYPWYKYYYDMEAQPTWWASDPQTGKPLMEKIVNLNCSDPNPEAGRPPRCAEKEVHVRNWNNTDAVAGWVKACTDQVAQGMDGCFIDGVCDGNCDVCCDATTGLGQGLAQMQKAIAPGVVIANNAYRGAYVGSVKGTMIENFGAKKGDLWTKVLQEIAQKGVLVQAHISATDCPPSEIDVASFLVAAGENSYLGCGAWFETPTGDDSSEYGGPHWYSQYYDRPLGAPKGPAVVANKVWKREFASGTSVVLDFNHMNATIKWADAL